MNAPKEHGTALACCAASIESYREGGTTETESEQRSHGQSDTVLPGSTLECVHT